MFPALKALRYCYSNVPAIDKIFFLVKRADVAIENSSSLLNDEELFGCADSSLVTGCEGELDEVFGEEELNMKGMCFVYVFVFLHLLLTQNFFFQR